MDIVNWDALKKGLLIKDTLESTDDLVLVAANTSYNKRGDLYQTYAVPASALGGGGGGGTYTVTNGLTETPANNFRLGGSLLGDTSIDAGGYGFNVSRTATGLTGAVFNVVNFSGNTPTAIMTLTDALAEGQPVLSLSKTDTAGIIPTLDYAAGVLSINIQQNTAPAGPANGITIAKSPGTLNSTADIAFTFNAFGAATVGGPANRISAKVYNQTTVNYRTDLEFFTSSGSIANIPTLAKKMSITGPGQLILDEYGSATFNGTVRYLLAVDTLGNVQEVTLAGLTNALNDAAAAAAGVPLSGIYRNGSVLQIRAV
jgi:hypothetical protein